MVNSSLAGVECGILGSMAHIRSSLLLSLILVVLSSLAWAEDPAEKKGDGKQSARKRALEHILPEKGELAWTQVPWHATLWDAVIEAQRRKMPILLWAMNGHALACT